MENKLVLHIISGLGDGGAEGVLSKLCLNDINNGYEHIVVSLLDEGKYGAILRAQGIEVHVLHMSGIKGTIKGIGQLLGLIRRLQPHVVQTWMYHADLVGGLVARLAGVKRLFWNIRQTELSVKTVKWSTVAIVRLCAILSSFLPMGIIYCAVRAKNFHLNLGYRTKLDMVVHNGISFPPNFGMAVNKSVLRLALNIPEESFLIGMVGRYDPVKDHKNLIAAAASFKKAGSAFKVLLVGKGMDDTNPALMNLLQTYELESDFILLGQRNDILEFMGQLDIHVLSSLSEGFPNVLLEAMLVGTPCISTDVGDASQIIGETGWLVPKEDEKALSNALLQAFEEKYRTPEVFFKRRKSAQERIQNTFSMEQMISAYHKVWSSPVPK